MEKIILFGAGGYVHKAIAIQGKENIAFIVDNDKSKEGTSIDEIPVYSFEAKKEECKSYEVVISVSEKYLDEIRLQLEENAIYTYTYFRQLQMEMTREKIQNRFDAIDIYINAIRWIDSNLVEEGMAIINNTGKKKGYPEVTGYYIPSLIRWGYRNLAKRFADWLICIQKEDGSWYDTDDNAPYIFDTAQILKGLLSIREISAYSKEIDDAIIAGCDWIYSQMTEEGRLITPDTTCWGDREDTCSELVHLYCISPLIEAGRIFDKKDYIEKAHKILAFYKENDQEKILSFSLLSHFYAYVVEALVDLGETDMAKEAMKNIEKYQKNSGSVPAYHNVDWVCSTGLFQLALIWFRLGEIERGNKAFEYACRLQNESGGWFGSYLSEENSNESNDYFPSVEISWANKYFLDALYYKNKAEFDLWADSFIETIDKEDERYTIVKESVSSHEQNSNVLDVGCGKGRYLKNLLEDCPDNRYFGVDISNRVMEGLKNIGIECREGTLTNISYPDGYFDLTYTCEALEHAVDIESAVRELARVTKPGGQAIIIDKNDGCYGELEICDWEQWPNEEELKNIMEKYFETVQVKHGLKYENMRNPDLFTAWIGQV